MSEPTWAPVKPGDVLAGKYRVERVLGAGGMGVVVCATHVDLGERRAVKFMLPHAVSSATAVERFFREARAAARLRGGHVAQVHDMGRLETGEPYIVMEYLEGADLAALLKKRGPLPFDLAGRYVLQACEALAEAHAAGIVHRDLKPANVFLTRAADGSPQIKVLDFGISKLVQTATPSELTDTEATIGSPYHMSPEQVRSSRDVDHRTDIWSLGVILYQLVTDTYPFMGEGRLGLCLAIVQEEPARPSSLRADIPPGLEAVILRCLEKSPDRRFSDVGKLAAAIAAILPDAETTLRVKRIARLAAGQRDGDEGPTGLEDLRSPEEPVPASTEGATGSSWGRTRGSALAPAHRAWLRWAVAGAVGVGVIATGLAARRALSPGASTPLAGDADPQETARGSIEPAAPAAPGPEPAPAASSGAPASPVAAPSSIAIVVTGGPPVTAPPASKRAATAGATPGAPRASAAPLDPPPAVPAPPPSASFSAAPPAPPATAASGDPFGRARK